MKKCLLLILVLMMLLCACTPKDSKVDTFLEHQDDFERIKNFLLEEASATGKYKTFSVIYNDDGEICDLYGTQNVVGESELESLNGIVNTFDTIFSFVGVGEGRVVFGGDGGDMYVYMVKNTSPKWFYSPGDGMGFTKEKLCDNWYHLYSNVR